MFRAVIVGAVAYFGSKKLHKRKKKKKRPKSKLDLASLMRGEVPAHGFVRGSTSKPRSITRKIGGWLSKLAGVAGIASMIAVGVFVYTEFTSRWQQRGMPMVPIQALSMPSGGTQPTHATDSRDYRQRRYQTENSRSGGSQQGLANKSHLVDYM